MSLNFKGFNMKLKNIVFASALLGLSALTATVAPALAVDTPKAVAIVDYEKVLHSSKIFSQTSVAFNNKYKAKVDQMSARNDALAKEDAAILSAKQKLDADIKSGKVTAASLKKREKELNDRIKIFQEKVAKFQQDAQLLEQERQRENQIELNKVEESIRKIISEYATKNGYTIVIDSAAVIYSQAGLNITDDVIKLVK